MHSGLVVIEYKVAVITVYRQLGTSLERSFDVPRCLCVNPDGTFIFGVDRPRAGQTVIRLSPDCTSQRCYQGKHAGQCPMASFATPLRVAAIGEALFRVVGGVGRVAMNDWGSKEVELRCPADWSSAQISELAGFARGANISVKGQPLPAKRVHAPIAPVRPQSRGRDESKAKASKRQRGRLRGPEDFMATEQRSQWWVPPYGSGGK